MVRLGAIVTLLVSLLLLMVKDIETSFTSSAAICDTCLKVVFLDVGQGDAIFIQTPTGEQALIDGGKDMSVLRELAAVMPRFDKTLDLVIGTHPDQDHIGGLVDVLNKYQVASIITTENTGETAVASAYHQSLIEETTKVHMARAGQVYTLGASTTITVYSPKDNPVLLESNTASIVVKVSYGEIDFMLTGDAPQGIEDYLVVTYGDSLQSEVLKLGHHGSKTSTSELFLEAVKPQYAIVSAGKDNSYGHPHQEVVERVTAKDIPILSTAEKGRVMFVTDGVSLW